MPRGAKGQRELLEKLEAMLKSNPGASAADLLKETEKNLVEEGVVKAPTTLSDETMKNLNDVVLPELKEKSLQVLITPEGGVQVRRKLAPKSDAQKAAAKAKKAEKPAKAKK